MKNTCILLVLLLFFACQDKRTPEASFEVRYAGALKNMMHDGDISANVSLDSFASYNHLFALGAFENLKGEIQIFDGKAYNSYVDSDSVLIDTSFSKKATLFVYAQVEAWKAVNVPPSVKNMKQLEGFIETTAKSENIDIAEPFPFRISGQVASADWHVIDWENGDTEHTHEKHIKSGSHGTLSNEAMDILGFYSRSHHAIFTHHSTNMHMHMLLKNKRLAGHLDNIEPGSKMILYLPVNK